MGKWTATAILAVSTALFAAPEARAADPEIYGVSEGAEAGPGGRILFVHGKTLTKISAYQLLDPGAIPIAPLMVLYRSKTLAILSVPPGVTSPTYTIPGPFILRYTVKTTTTDVMIQITNGAPAAGSVSAANLSASLLTDLNDAATVGGMSPADLQDWNNLTNVPSGFADGTDDSTALAGNGVATTASRSDHNHDAAYPTRTELGATGTINSAGNAIHWTQLKGVPAGIADGVDDGGGSITAGNGLTLNMGVLSANFAGTGAANTVSRSDHDHNATYYTETELNATGGTINSGSNPVDWTRLKSVPAGFADGTDADTTYSAGTGLSLATTTFSVNFAGTGSANTAARSDHGHSAFTGNVSFSSGTITVTSSGTAISATTTGSGTSILSSASSGFAFRGSGNIGVIGECDSDGIAGVVGIANYS